MSAIWTSRYSNPELKRGRYYAVGISIGKPKWKLGYELRGQSFSLAPKGYMLNMCLERFKPAYYQKLEAIGTDKISGMVTRLYEEAKAEGKELGLLCYEDIRDPAQWCHRTVFAEWWAEHTGEIIEELPDPTQPKIKKPVVRTEETEEIQKPQKPAETFRQMSLFDTGFAGL